jgi:hypothetical protein
MPTTSNNKLKFLSIVTLFFSLNISLVTFIFLHACHLLFNAWSLKLIRPIITSICVSCIITGKHFTSSLWINAIDFIFRLLHIANLRFLIVLFPLCSPCIPLVDCAHLFIECDHTFIDCIEFFIDCVNKSNDYVKTHDDETNIVGDLANNLDRSSSDLCISHPSLLQLLFTNL